MFVFFAIPMLIDLKAPKTSYVKCVLSGVIRTHYTGLQWNNVALSDFYLIFVKVTQLKI